jgi:uncharacterized protein
VTTPLDIAELARQRLAEVDMSGFTDLFAADAVFEYPFGFPGAPAVLHGREHIRTHLVESRRLVRSLIKVTDMAATTHRTVDPAVVVVEWEVSGSTIATGHSFRFGSGVGIITVRDGEIVRFRDYTNPVGAAAVTGRLAELATSLAAQAEPVG